MLTAFISINKMEGFTERLSWGHSPEVGENPTPQQPPHEFIWLSRRAERRSRVAVPSQTHLNLDGVSSPTGEDTQSPSAPPGPMSFRPLI